MMPAASMEHHPSAHTLSIEPSTSLPSASRPPRPPAWKCILLQPVPIWTMIATLPVVIALIIVATTSNPATRPYLVYGATIAYTTNPSTIPYWAAWLLPGIVFLCTVAMAEYYAQPTKPRNAVLAMALAWHTVVDSVAGLIVVNFLTEIGKDVVGFLRPDYLARCQPPGNNSTMSDIVLAWGSAVVSATCTQTGSSVVDGRRSFPSGHSSSVAYWAGYAAVYWCAQTSALHASARYHSKWKEGALSAAALYLVLLFVGWAFGVGCSRVIDNKHHPADVAAGWLLGAGIAVVFAARGMCVHTYSIHEHTYTACSSCTAVGARVAITSLAM